MDPAPGPHCEFRALSATALHCCMRFAIVALVLLAGVANAQEAPPDVSGLQLVTDNAAAAAQSSLVATKLTGVDGAPTDRTVNLAAGFSISQIASGLDNPRFMQFDDAGNLLVADDDAGKIYRYPSGLAPASQPPAPLLSGLGGPSNVALHD